MRKMLLPLLFVMIITACKKETVADKTQEEMATSVAAKSPSSKINICHYDAAKGTWKTSSINLSAWPDHQAHGDVRLDDVDGDGYVPNNNCGFGQQGDCDDNNHTINPGATEIIGNGIDENCNGLVDDWQIGGNYQGGKLAYILQPGDPGYDANVRHGLIAAPSTGITTAGWGCYGTVINGANGTALGTGNQNTIEIMRDCSTEGIAARVCGDLVVNGYDDWYLPSLDEMMKLVINHEAIDLDHYYYWTSTQNTGNWAYYTSWAPVYGYGSGSRDFGSSWRVRAVRSF